MKQISIQITSETARQIAGLAEHWGLAPQRHNTPVVERAVATVHLLEIGYEVYQRRMAELTTERTHAPMPTDSHIPQLLRTWSAGLRSGYSLGQAINRSAGDFDDPGLTRAAELVSDGVRPLAALAEWQTADGTRDSEIVVSLVASQMETGGNLADKLDFLAGVL